MSGLSGEILNFLQNNVSNENIATDCECCESCLLITIEVEGKNLHPAVFRQLSSPLHHITLKSINKLIFRLKAFKSINSLYSHNNTS